MLKWLCSAAGCEIITLFFGERARSKIATDCYVAPLTVFFLLRNIL